MSARDVDPFVGWHCSGAFGRVRCGEPCAWCRDEAAKNRTALAAAGHVIEQDWQPIETAPRDGTRFIAWWQPCEQSPAGGWHECQWWNGAWYHPLYNEPTHWKPPPVDGPHLTAAKEPQA